MSDNVVTLHGVAPKPDAEPNATLVEELERLLAAARAGEIVGLAGAYVHRGGPITYSYAGAIGNYGLLGGIACVKERLLRLALSREDGGA